MNERFMTLERKALIAARSRSINIDSKNAKTYNADTNRYLIMEKTTPFSFSSLEKRSKLGHDLENI